MTARPRVGFKYYAAQSLNANVTGPVMRVASDRSLSFSVTTTGTIVGTWVLKSSNTPDDASSFAEVPLSAAEFTAQGANPAGTAFTTPKKVNFVNMPDTWWRLDFTNGSSTGTGTVTGGQGDIF